MQFINFPPRKLGQKVVIQSVLPESENPGNNAVTDKSDLAVHAEDAKLVAGRSWPALKQSKPFDSQRLATSPLFNRRLF